MGPSWKGLYGKTETMADGSTALVDEAYLRSFIRDPQARQVKGFPPVMPKIELSDDELAALVAYIKSLGSPPTQAATDKAAMISPWPMKPRDRRVSDPATSGARTTRSSRSSTRAPRSRSAWWAWCCPNLMRLQLGFPGQFAFINAERYYQFVTMHGMIMVIYLLTALFLGGFGNYLIPLMVGARDMVFPT